jgi:hypothetical protein
MEAYKEFDGSTIWGKGIVRDSTPQDRTNYKYVFENKTGRTFFNSAGDQQAKGIKLLTNLESQ